MGAHHRRGEQSWGTKEGAAKEGVFVPVNVQMKNDSSLLLCEKRVVQTA